MSVLRINQNPIALNANRNLRNTGRAIAKSIERLSSGLRINRAADDAAGLSISEKLRAQIRGLNRASANALDGVSLIQTAEGALNEMHTILQRMRELAVQAANGIYTANDRQALQLEIHELTSEINRISATTEFNTKRLLDGTMGALVSTDDYTRVRAAVVGNVGEGGNFVLRAAAKSTGVLQVQKSDVFTVEQNADAVGLLNYMHIWRAGTTITTAGPDGVGNTGIYQVEISVTGGDEIFAGNTDGDLTIWDDSGGAGAYALAVTANNVLDNFQNHEITLNDDRFIFTTYDDINGVLVHSIVLDAANTASWTALCSAIYTEFDNNGGTNLVTVPGSVAFGTVPGTLGIQLNGANNAKLLNVQFVDSDESGSDFYMSFAETAPTQINDAGGIGGTLLQLVSRDDQSQPDVAISRAEELCAWEKVVALTGGYVDSLVGPISEVAKKHHIPYVASSSLQKELVLRENDYFFRVSNLQGFEAPLCDVISEQFHPKHMAIIHAATPGSTQLAQDLETCLASRNIPISLIEKFRPGTPDFTPLISKIKQMNVDVIVSGGFTPDHILFVRQLKENNASLHAYVGPFGVAYESFIAEMGDDADYLFSTAAWTPESTLPGSEALSLAFIQKFKSMFNRRPNTTNMHGYTSAKALIEAMQNAAYSGKTLTGPNIRQALVNLDLTLPMEHLVFDQKGDPRHYRHVVVQIQKGKLEIVYPKNRATSEAVYPMPTWEKRK